MRISRQTKRFARARLIPLVAGGAIVGALAGLQVAAMIERAGIGGLFGGAAPIPVEPIGEKPREEDREIGAALAAAIRADRVADCRTFERRHRAGCRAYVERRRTGGDLFGPPPDLSGNDAADRSSASGQDWPAAFD